MKSEIALRLLADVLEWDVHELSNEFRYLELITKLKYDNYQGFNPASRFQISLVNWLSQFETIDQRRVAYRFINENLVFVSQREMYHLVSLMMPEIERKIRTKVALELGLKFYQTWTDPKAIKRIKLMKRRTLFIGLSDGARIDIFRRYNEGVVSNEQVVPFSEITNDKWDDLKSELSKWLKEHKYETEQPLFEMVCLVDDFTGSGRSLIRWEGEEVGTWKGKISKFYKSNQERFNKYLIQDCEMLVHHHLATDKAKESIEECITKFCESNPGFKISLNFSHVLSKSIVITKSTNLPDFISLVESFYDPDIQDTHKGNVKYGYSDCGLPLILEHNTPNNSIALLWANSPPEKEKTTSITMRPLFPRRERHSANG